MKRKIDKIDAVRGKVSHHRLRGKLIMNLWKGWKKNPQKRIQLFILYIIDGLYFSTLTQYSFWDISGVQLIWGVFYEILKGENLKYSLLLAVLPPDPESFSSKKKIESVHINS